MSRISSTKRKKQIKKRRLRRGKLAKLRDQYAASDSSLEKEKIWEKVARLAPWLTESNFLSPIKKKTS